MNISANHLQYKAAIVGERSGDNLTNNYYINCSLISTDPNNSFTITSDIGRAYLTGGNYHEDVTTNDGAVAVWAVTLADEYVTVTNPTTPTVSYNGTNYYKNGVTVTIGHDNRTARGYVFVEYRVTKDGTDPVETMAGTLSDGLYTFNMPNNHLTAAAVYRVEWLGNGTAESPYRILEREHLDTLAAHVNSGNAYYGKYFKLDADITYPHTSAWDNNNSTENNYVSIGTANHKFCGNFDGNYHTISGIRIYKDNLGVGGDFDNNGGRIGIFGYINNATIEKIILTDCRYTGYNDVGGIVGQMQGGKVSHCHVLSDVVIYSLFSSASDHGGVVGTCNHQAGGIVEYCSSSAKVISRVVNNGGSNFGGLVGGGGGYVRNNLVIGATVDSARHWYGAISGSYEDQGYYSNNYYRECTVAGLANARSRGTQGVNIDGTKPCFLITCGENISTNAMTFTIPAHGNVPATTYVFSTDQSEVHVYYNVLHDANREAVLTVSRIDDDGDVYRTDDVTEGGYFQMGYSDVSIALKGFNIKPNKWYAISSPSHDDGETYESISSVSNLASGTYDMFRYNESTMTWENQKASDGIAEGFSTLEAGRGYIYRFGGNDNVTLHYSGIDNAGAVQYEVTNTNSVPNDMRGFNLIGNPYPHQIYYGTAIPTTNLDDNYYYSLDPNGCWHIRSCNEPIGIGEAVLVMADQTGTHTVTFSDNANPPAKNYCNSLKFTVSDGVDEDVAYAVIKPWSEEKTGLPKIAHLDNELPSLSINMKNSNYAMAAIDAETSELPLHFSGKTGKYTISVEAMENAGYLHLIDLQTGNDIDLLSNPTYTFTQSGNNTSAQGDRFLVKFSQDNSQLSTLNSLFAYQSGDQTIITGTGALQVFDLMGRQIFSHEVNSQLSIPNSKFPGNGVYILRLGEKSQKIVIR